MQFHSYNLSFNKSTTDSNSCIFCSNRLLKLKNSKIRIIITEGGPVNNLRQSICICSHTLKKLDTARF